MMPLVPMAQRPFLGLSIARFILLAGFAWPVMAEKELSFNHALQLALQQSPRLRTVDEQISSTRQLISSAEQLPAPVISLAIDNWPVSGGDRFSIDNDFMTMRRVSWMQEIPNSEKRTAQKELAQAQQQLMQADALSEKQFLQRDTALAWLNRFYVEKQLQQLTDLESDNRQLNALTRQQFSAGKIAASEALLPQQEAIELALLRDDLNSKRTQSIAQLRRFIGDEAQRELGGLPPTWSLQLDTLQHHLHHHPDLQRIDAQRTQLQAKISEAKAAQHANWSYELAYQKRGGEFGDMVSLQWSIELPFFNRDHREAELRFQYAEATTLDAERESLQREHIAMLSSEFAEYQRLQQKLTRLQNEVLPLLVQKSSLTKSQWLNGKSQLRDLIAVHKEQLSAELNAIATQHELQQMTAILIYNYRADENANGEQTP